MPRTRIQLEGHNGSWFTLAGEGEGDQGVFLGTDVNGIYDAPVSTIWNSHAFQKGADYGGKRYLKRDMVFGVVIDGEATDDWELLDSEWRKAWSYDRDSRLWVETDTSRRYLKLRLAEQPKFAPEFDPGQAQTERIVMTCVSGDPFWYEDDATDVWTATTDTTGGSTESGTVTISNPTDQPIWLKYVVQAHPGARYTLPDFSWGDDRYEMGSAHAARKIVMPALDAGEHLVVDTDEETTQVESNTDTQVYLRMNGVRFLYPVPPYTPPTELPVSVTKAPPGVGVQVRCPRPWSRPWGLQ